MPLVKSSSDAAFRTNVAEMIRAGHPRDQALAASFANQRRNRDAGGGIGTAAQGPYMLVPAGAGTSGSTPTPSSPSMPAAPATSPLPGPPSTIGPALPTMPAPASPVNPSPYSPSAGLGALAALFGQLATPRGGYGIGAPAGFAAGGMPSMNPPWFVRSEARQMGHTGPIHSPVAGRTDHIPMSVPSGAYVIPADVVSGRGQGNSMAGQNLMHRMFGTGPLGTPLPHGGHGGAGAPKPPAVARQTGTPKPPKLFAEGGGAEDETPWDTGETVPILAAGGEYIVHPRSVWQIGGGNIDLGHKILDQFVKDERAKLVKTLKTLPGPARD